jgi:hypothetical protein
MAAIDVSGTVPLEVKIVMRKGSFAWLLQTEYMSHPSCTCDLLLFYLGIDILNILPWSVLVPFVSLS